MLTFYILRIFFSHYTDRSKNHHTWQRFSKRRKNRSKGWTAIAWGGWASSCLCDSQQSRKCQEGCWKGHFILPLYLNIMKDTNLLFRCTVQPFMNKVIHLLCNSASYFKVNMLWELMKDSLATNCWFNKMNDFLICFLFFF